MNAEQQNHLENLATQCIRCGFCLEDCPTYLLTGSELESPRGRIYLIRSAMEGKLSWTEDVSTHTDQCLGCRACETACPSGVEYGQILEIARQIMCDQKPNRIRNLILSSTTSPVSLKAQLAASRILPGEKFPRFLSQLISGQGPEANLPRPQPACHLPEIENPPPLKGRVYFLEGCAMSVLFSRVHECSKRLLRRVGFEVVTVPQGCCGALHAHNGDLPKATSLAQHLMQNFTDDIPIIVNSAGCGSYLKEFGVHQDTAEAQSFSHRIKDLSEFLYEQRLTALLENSHGLQGETVSYHDACHLSHGQKITEAPRRLIRSIQGANFIELPESLMCCGSAGIYNLLQPKIARDLLNRKIENIRSIGAKWVAMGNPGCHGWIRQGCEEQAVSHAVHTAELLEASFIGTAFLDCK